MGGETAARGVFCNTAIAKLPGLMGNGMFLDPKDDDEIKTSLCCKQASLR